MQSPKKEASSGMFSRFTYIYRSFLIDNSNKITILQTDYIVQIVLQYKKVKNLTGCSIKITGRSDCFLPKENGCLFEMVHI